ncbi:MAG: hypothetical protein CNCCGFBP_02001 [Fimbriimonadaceae bacterium]|nr:hypothetical protein [Fimbriimonadaceae bacterium]
MLSILIASALQGLPTNLSVDFSGMPLLRTDAPASYRVLSHSVTLELVKGEVIVNSTTLYKNGPEAKTLTLTLPRRRFGDSDSGAADFAIAGTWDRLAIPFRALTEKGSTKTEGSHTLYRSDLGAQVKMAPNATHALKIAYKTPVGVCGYERKQRIVGYQFEGSGRIEQLNFSFKYTQQEVFNLPDPRPEWPWQIGTKGAYIRREPFDLIDRFVYFTFYPGGFRPTDGG